MCSPHEFVRPTTTTLVDNNIGDGGAKDLAKALEVNSSLQTLVLAGECGCCMVDWGPAVLACIDSGVRSVAMPSREALGR